MQRKLASTQTQRLIAGGVDWLQGSAWKRVAKNGDEVPENAELRLLDKPQFELQLGQGARAAS